MRLIIRREIIRMLIELARGSKVEVCGFLFGRRDGDDWVVEEIREVPNRLNSPNAFEMEPFEMVRAIEEAEERGLEIIGIFHSHLECPPVPSKRDLEGMRLWPVPWLIVDEKGNYGAYVLEGNKIREVRIVEKE
ncbi:M67 family metallopeptidase [Thermococcus sp.]